MITFCVELAEQLAGGQVAVAAFAQPQVEERVLRVVISRLRHPAAPRTPHRGIRGTLQLAAKHKLHGVGPN